ncbi:hypothetical protein GCM10009555_061210 [Acrocarpospora macrocephala]|uniref:Helicase C-terminal domain-containing protein n=1 Tax=Acrocarpospora macrocephala TaxID=150177 RepID=A0A5M3WKZ2_9ACTN|nr:hypothetical protein [Acrocarpospora macrocephala]GES09564.1 hypothetical protein Amac_031600 [Acrocarpospora macrocephala]
MTIKPRPIGSKLDDGELLARDEPGEAGVLVTVDSSAKTAESDAGKHAQRVALHADQERLVRRFIEVSHERLAGRGPEARRLRGRQPREQVVLGVLAPQDPPVVDQMVVAQDLPAEPGVPVDQLPASEFGLTCLVMPSEKRLTVDVKLHFALYLQHFPTYEEQFEHAALVARKAGELDEAEASSSSASGDEDASEGSGPMDQRAGTTEKQAALNQDAHVSVTDAVANHSGPEALDESADRPRSRRANKEASDPILLVYRRYNINLTLQLSIPVPRNSVPITIDDQGVVRSAVVHALGDQGTSDVRTSGIGPAGGPYRLLDSAGQRIPRKAMSDPETFDAWLTAHGEPGWTAPTADPQFTVTAHRDPTGRIRLALTLSNAATRAPRDRGFLPEVSVYDASFEATITGGSLLNMGYRTVDTDYRIAPLVYAHGRFCCLDEDASDPTAGRLVTTAFPVFRQAVYESRPDLEPTFKDLAQDPVRVLSKIADHMQGFLDRWDEYLASEPPLSDEALEQCRADRDAFADERRRFAAGIGLIETDLSSPSPDGIGLAFCWMNQAMRRMDAPGGVYTPTGPPAVRRWRLFQIVFIVLHLAALTAREPSGEQLRDELNYADVLWFPTGGGKSAALYGITATAMFYDRLRGKSFGTTCIIRFPLRMLSVQQLDRILRLIVCCELVRSIYHEHTRGTSEDEIWDLGEPFELGYFVGRNNTPNRLTDAADTKWRDIDAMAMQNTSWRRENVVLPTCPYCGNEQVALRPDTKTVRLRHTCPDCSRDLPVSITDDEVYRYLPTVLVATVDKLATIAFNPHFSHLTHGPAHRCPDHGFVTFRQGSRSEPRCLAREHCGRNPREWSAVRSHDPAPALAIQDELHLLAEELGTFAAHYETLWQHLCRTGSGLPSKVLAATATISDYANQVRQLYALRPRRFPSEGWVDGQSFYARRHDDLTRRIFVGALPSLMDTSTFSLACGDAVRRELERLRALDAADVITELGLTTVTPDHVDEWLFAYELQLYYVNRKTDADHVLTHASRAGVTADPAPFQAQRLTGANRLAEISEVIRRVERETIATPAGRRLAVIAGTSLVSHGVDLARLNVQFVLGMPSTLAYYVQATSRAGRSQVGLVFTALNRYHLRDRSVFHFFDPTHRHVNTLVEPVALNRFSLHAPRKTASGLVAALLLSEIGRDSGALEAIGPAPVDFGKAVQAEAWLAAVGEAGEMRLRDSIYQAFGLRSEVLDSVVAESFRLRVDHVLDELLASLSGTDPQLQRRLRPRPPTSFRDIDAPADFSALGGFASRMFTMLGGDDSNDDLPDMADEGGNT